MQVELLLGLAHSRPDWNTSPRFESSSQKHVPLTWMSGEGQTGAGGGATTAWRVVFHRECPTDYNEAEGVIASMFRPFETSAFTSCQNRLWTIRWHHRLLRRISPLRPACLPAAWGDRALITAEAAPSVLFVRLGMFQGGRVIRSPVGVIAAKGGLRLSEEFTPD
eukprot:766809-Hanusia_phi.AAC.3